jgi:hypothetical protein
VGQRGASWGRGQLKELTESENLHGLCLDRVVQGLWVVGGQAVTAQRLADMHRVSVSIVYSDVGAW